MIKGLDQFREHFRSFQESYTLIGGAASYLLMDDAGLTFRATKDLDIVLCIEAIDTSFIVHFWEFVKIGGYLNQQRGTENKQLYRFEKPSTEGFPAMLELFSRVPDHLGVAEGAHLTPIPAADEHSSLSAILLDDNYYRCIQHGRQIIDDIPVLGAEYILAFKARAWLDLRHRKEQGQNIDSRAIKKHRNDVFRLSLLLAPSRTVELSHPISQDLQTFINAMPTEPGLDLKNLGVSGSLQDVLDRLRAVYQLEE